MILVTGATGHLGAAVIDFLLKKVPANQIAALVRDEAKASGLKEKGISIRVANYHNYPSLVPAFKGVDKILLVSSSDFNDRAGQQINVINAAKEAGVKHVIYTSVATNAPTTTVIPMVVDSHIATANHLKASGLTYTLLNNNLYADVLPMFLGEKVVETGVFIPGGEGRVPYASRLDMAEAAANVLAGTGHDDKEYTIASDVTYSFADIAQLLSKLANKQVVYVDAPHDAYTAALAKAGVPPAYVGVMSGFAEAIKKNEFNLPGTELENLLGRKPASLESYLQKTFF
ncbi:NAD(P)H dehydrogenase (quinone) [Chitinophaga sp. W3I9]|uniref:SDR family oxidoreductase n=1 Tax=unclassified Chitinophaga TaxID=2619133 RepID=UPI003D1C07A6